MEMKRDEEIKKMSRGVLKHWTRDNKDSMEAYDKERERWPCKRNEHHDGVI
jgi:hypothetical protein